MNKSELVDAIVAKTAETKKATEATVNALVEVIAEALKKEEKVSYHPSLKKLKKVAPMRISKII